MRIEHEEQEGRLKHNILDPRSITPKTARSAACLQGTIEVVDLLTSICLFHYVSTHVEI